MSTASTAMHHNQHKVGGDVFSLPKALLAVFLALPLGVVTALAGVLPVFGSILPVSVLLGLVCPIIVPVIAIAGFFYGIWLCARAAVRTLIRMGRHVVALAKPFIFDARTTRALRALSHVHEIAYMGLHGVFILSTSKPAVKEPSVPPKSPASPHYTRLVIADLPGLTLPTFPLTPPSSNPSHSPTLTESTDGSCQLQTPIDEPTHSSLTRLSDMLGKLANDELDLVASYVEILKKGRTSSSAIASE